MSGARVTAIALSLLLLAACGGGGGGGGLNAPGAGPATVNPPSNQQPSTNPPASSPPSSTPPSSNPPSSTPPSSTPTSSSPPTTPPGGDPSSGNPPSGSAPSGSAPAGNPPSGNPPSGTPPSSAPPSSSPPSSSPPSSTPVQNDFTLSAPGTVSIAQGTSGTITVTIVQQGSPGTIALSLSGSSLLSRTAAANTVSYAFTPDGANSKLALAVGSSVPAANYALTVTGTAGSLSHTASFTLVVTTPAAGGTNTFGISAPGSVSIRQGGIVTLAVAATGTGFAGGTFTLSSPTALSLSGTARLYGSDTGRVGYSFDSVSQEGGNLTLYVGSGVATGSYALTITASAGGESHTAPLTLNVLARGTVYEIWPGANSYQNALQTLRPGDVLVLHQGTYSGYAELTLSGTPQQPITIRGYGQGEAKPVLSYTGSAQNQWEIRGSNLIVQGLQFNTPATYSIRIRPPASGNVANVSLINNTFLGCGEGCVSANDAPATYSDIRMIDNLVVDAQKTPVYIGNHPGLAVFHNFLFEGNVVDGRLIVATDVVGYGIEVKLNVEDAELRNNYIVGARGPGIMTYGLDATKDPLHGDIVENNIVIGSCTDRNILIGAGPTIARNNLAMGGHSDGFGIYDYGNRHLSRGIQILGDTALLNQTNGFWVTSATAGTGLADLRMMNNLAYPPTGGVAYANLPASNGTNQIANNNTASATAAMPAAVAKLQHVIPSPQALKAVWPLLANGPLNATSLTSILNTLGTLPNQSTNNSPRACSP